MPDNNSTVKYGTKDALITFGLTSKENIEKNVFESLKKIQSGTNSNIYYKENIANNKYRFVFDEKSKIEQHEIKHSIEFFKKKNKFWPKKDEIIGKCKIDEFVGSGLTANVYRAVHKFLGIDVALKILSEELKTETPEIEEMFLQEARNTARLRHENLVNIFDADKGEKYTYMVMEFIEGIDLARLLEQKKIPKPIQVIGMMIKITDALDYALENGYIHRDVKPGNIMISKKAEIKLLDLGLSKVLTKTTQRERGDIVGTPHYMAPEQFVDPENIDHRADMYSLGSTFYHLLTGEFPFNVSSLKEIVEQKLIKSNVPYITSNEIPYEFKEVIFKLMQKNPDDRIQSYKELKENLLLIKKTLL